VRPSGLRTASSSPPSPGASLRDAYLATGTGCTSRTNLTHTTLLITRYLKACPLVQRLLAAPPILSGAPQTELFCSFPYTRNRPAPVAQGEACPPQAGPRSPAAFSPSPPSSIRLVN